MSPFLPRKIRIFLYSICLFFLCSFPLHAENLQDRIPTAVQKLMSYSVFYDIPISYIRHDLLEMIQDMENKEKQTILKMLNMERELELENNYHKSAWFEVHGTTAYMYGRIDSSIYQTITTLFHDYSDIEKIVMIYVPGSLDDFTNFKTIKYLRTKNIILEIHPKGFIASGGVDFLLAGTTRNIYRGAKIGVHSRRYNSVKDAIQLAKEDKRHKVWLDFYEAIGIPSAYYRFVLSQASADEAHWMTEEELLTFGFTDKIIIDTVDDSIH